MRLVQPLLRIAAGMVFLAPWNHASTEESTVLRGNVRDPSGRGLPGVTLYVRGTSFVTRSDHRGDFALRGPTNGTVQLVATLPGFEATLTTLQLPEQADTIRIRMSLAAHREVVQVKAHDSAADADPRLELSPIDAYRTAGTLADPLRALQMLPGVASIDEGAGLFVRGGDVSETATWLDRARLSHPYRYEDTSGGLFGVVPAYFLSKVSLSTGGFPARYGNVLSGVLELTGHERPIQPRVQATIGLAAASSLVSIPLGSGAGVRLAGNQRFPELLFSVNKPRQHFERYPGGYDANISAHLDSRRSGRFKVFAYTSEEDVGVEIEQDAFRGVLSSRAQNRAASIGWEKQFGRGVLVQATASATAYRQSIETGVVALSTVEDSGRTRLDITHSSGRWTTRVGGEWERGRDRLEGVTSRSGGDLAGIRGVREWTLDFPMTRLGSYAELDHRGERLGINLGLRIDWFDAIQGYSVDPRLSFRYSLSPAHSLRAAWGIYHQAPASAYFDPDFGNPELDPMNAMHWILGYRFGEESSPLHLRLETYYKDYESLPLEHKKLNFVDQGFGYATGVDALVKITPSHTLEGWASYSFVRARRLYTPVQDYRRYPVPERAFRPDFEIPHTLQLSFRAEPFSWLGVGASFRLASGKPFTGIVDAARAPSGWIPVFGPLNAERYPSYQRLDVNTSHIHRVSEGAAIFFVGVSNLLDRLNVFQFAYSEDFSAREPARSSWGRTWYLGVTYQR